MRRPCPRAALLLLVALTTPACDRKEPPPPAQPEPAAPSATSSAGKETPPTPPTSVAQAAPTASSPAAPSSSPADQALEAQHTAAMARARGAVLAKDYKKAILAFNEARALLPEDARTLGERGYVKFLSGDTTFGEIDLTAATSLKGDAKTLAQVWYNLGLAYEARKMEELGRMAFAASVSLSPSKAAEGKLQGKSRCAASMVPSPLPDAVLAKGWLGVWNALNKPDAANPKPSSEAEAKETLCAYEGEGRCEGAQSWMVPHSYETEHVHASALVVSAGPGTFFVLNVGVLGTSGCTPYTAFDSEVLAKVVRAKYTAHFKYRVDTTMPGVGPSLECVEGGSLLTDILFDRATGKKLVTVERPGSLEPPVEVNVLPDESGVTVAGHGCKEKLPLTPSAPR